MFLTMCMCMVDVNTLAVLENFLKTSLQKHCSGHTEPAISHTVSEIKEKNNDSDLMVDCI